MSEFTDGYVQSNNIRMHYYRTGQPGKTAILMLHGVTGNGMCWVRVARALAGAFDIVMLDARGRGRSDAPEHGYTSEDHAADVAGVIQALELDRPVLFGHSMGARTAMTAAALYPTAMRSIILEDPPLRTPMVDPAGPEEMARRLEQRRAEILANRAMSQEALVQKARKENPQWPEEEYAPWAEAKRQVSPNIAETYATPRLPWQQVLAQVRCPALLITADPKRSAIVSPEAAAEAAAILKSLQVEYIPNAGHCIHRDQFDLTMQAVKRFLEQAS